LDRGPGFIEQADDEATEFHGGVYMQRFTFVDERLRAQDSRAVIARQRRAC